VLLVTPRVRVAARPDGGGSDAGEPDAAGSVPREAPTHLLPRPRAAASRDRSRSMSSR
jgi:hypothetical protein